MFAPRHSTPPSVETRIEKGASGTPLKVVETWFAVLSVSYLIPVLRRFRAQRHERNYRLLCQLGTQSFAQSRTPGEL